MFNGKKKIGEITFKLEDSEIIPSDVEYVACKATIAASALLI